VSGGLASPVVSEIAIGDGHGSAFAVAVVMPIYARESPRHALIFLISGVLFALSARGSWDSSEK
jgi:hypothetical protein